MKSTRIAIVRAGPLAFQQHITTLANYLGDSFDATLLSLSPQECVRPTELAETVRFAPLTWRRGTRLRETLSRLGTARRLAASLRSLDPHITYVVDSWTLPIFWAARGFRLNRSAQPTVYHTYDMLEPGVHNRSYLMLERSICRKAHLVVNTDRARAHYQHSLYRLPRVPLYIRNALPRDAQLPDRSAQIRRELLGNDHERFKLFVYPSRASAERVTLEVIRAFAALPSHYWLFTIVAEDEYGRKCRELAAQLGVTNRIIFSAPLSHDKLTVVCASSDVGAIFHDPDCAFGNFMSNPDRLPRFVALGVPFVAQAVPNLESDVYRFGLGACCDPKDPQATAAAVLGLCEGSPSLAERRAHMKRVFQTELNFEEGAKPLKEALDKLVCQG